MKAKIASAALLLAACTGSSAPPFVKPRLPHPVETFVLAHDGYLYEAERVAPFVHTIQSPEPFHWQPLGNVTVIEQTDGLVLVDAGGTEPAAERVIALLRQMLPGKRVKAIVLTHWHGDHVLGLRRLLREWPDARTISTVATKASLESPATLSYVPVEDRAATRAMLDEMHRTADWFASRNAVDTLPADVRHGFTRASRVMHHHARDLESIGNLRVSTSETFTDVMGLPDRHAPAEVRFLGRANTDGDAVVWLPRQRILITGDIVVAPMPYGFYSYPAEWIDVLKRLKTYPFAQLIPGHGRPMGDATYVDALIELITDVRAQVGTAVRDSLTVEQVRQRVDFSAARKRFAGEDGWRHLIFDYYWVDPIVKSAFMEARGQPVRQGESRN